MTSSNLKIFFSAFVAVCLSGCTSIAGSYSPSIPSASSSSPPISGTPYGLPMAKVNISILRDTQGIAISVSQPQYSADPMGSYVLSYQPSASSVDRLNIQIGENGLLTKVESEADDKTSDILVELGKLALGTPESSVGATQTLQTLANIVIDPNDSAQLRNAEIFINGWLTARLPSIFNRECDFAQHQSESASLPDKADERKKTIDELRRKAFVDTAACYVAYTYSAPNISLNFDYIPFTFSRTVSVAPCTVGFCSRKQNPATLSFLMDGTQFVSAGFMIPNGSDPIPHRLDRTFFAKLDRSVTLTNGMIVNSSVSKGSELLTVAETPLKIVKGAVTTAAELVQLRINLTGKNKELADAQADLIEAEKKLKEAQENASELVAESAITASQEPMIFVYVPGLGPGSGAGLGPPSGISNAADKGATAATPPKSDDKSTKNGGGKSGTGKDDTSAAEDALGTKVVGSSDG